MPTSVRDVPPLAAVSGGGGTKGVQAGPAPQAGKAVAAPSAGLVALVAAIASGEVYRHGYSLTENTNATIVKRARALWTELLKQEAEGDA